MKRLFIVTLLVASVFTVSGQSQDEYKFSLVPRRLAVPSLTGYLKADGTVPLTADWNVGAFDLTCVDMNATNFKLSGTGTLTSTAGNASFTTSLTAASGNEVAYTLNYTTNKAAGDDTGLLINQTDTASPGTSRLLDLAVASTSKWTVTNGGTMQFASGATYMTKGALVFDMGYLFTLSQDIAAGDNVVFGSNSNRELTDTDGSQAWISIEPKINQSGTAGYQALKINVTETALGSGATGANRLLTAQVGSVEKVGIDNEGKIIETADLNDATGNESAFTLNYTTNKATSGNDTGLLINQTDTASPGTSYLIDAQVGGASKFYVNNSGNTYANAVLITGGSLYFGTSGGSDGTIYFGTNSSSGTCLTLSPAGGGSITNTSGQKNVFAITPTYNQTSGTAANTDLLINRTQTAIGSGQQNLIDAQVASTSRFRISNKGFETRAYPLACTHDTATALFGITVAVGSTAGGVITYTLNVTDDDGSDDQIEVGTVQFCGLQDEANWHTNISEVSTQALESGTLATTWAIDTATANTMKITLQANSNLTSPVYTLSYTVTWNNSYTVTTY